MLQMILPTLQLLLQGAPGLEVKVSNPQRLAGSMKQLVSKQLEVTMTKAFACVTGPVSFNQYLVQNMSHTCPLHTCLILSVARGSKKP